MICPNCGETFEHDVHVCPVCDTPLSNAIYTPVSTPQKGKGKLILFLLVLILAAMGAGGYYYFQTFTSQIKADCKKQTEELFEAMRSTDFSEIDPAFLPKYFKQDSTVKEMIKESVQNKLMESSISAYLTQEDSPIDMDRLINDITGSASYKITHVAVTPDACTVTVNTSNIDYDSFMASLADKVSENLETDQSLWDSFKEKVKGFFFGSDDESADISEAIRNIIEDTYADCLDTAPRKECTSTVRYSVSLKKPTKKELTFFDPELINTFYGMHLITETSE